jgi:hypothetical protein
MAEPRVSRRAYYEILYVAGDFPLLESLAEEGALETRPDDDDITGISGRINSVLDAMPRDDDGLNPAERLRIVDGVLRHGRVGGGVASEVQHDRLRELVNRATLTGDMPPDISGEDLADSAIHALDALYRDGPPPSLRHAMLVMPPESRALLTGAFGSSTMKAAARYCSADPVRVDNGSQAIRITTRYQDPRPVNEFIFPANPGNWPTCNPFFQSVTPIPGGYSQPPDELKGRYGIPVWGRIQLESHLGDMSHGGARARYKEVVDFGVTTVTTDLDMVLYVSPPGGTTQGAAAIVRDSNPDAIATGMSFEFAKSDDGIIDVDYGYLHVREVGGQTMVESSKTIRFAKAIPNAQSASACRLGWLDSVELMNQCQG